jgi:pimeloyl-ACP methyl ester carboxylesterase
VRELLINHRGLSPAAKVAWCFLICASVISGCQSGAHSSTPADAPMPGEPPIVAPLPAVAPDVWAGRGALVDQVPFDDVEGDLSAAGVKAWRAVYGSVSGVDGSATHVSGSFFIPGGPPPEGGWPVISVGHATTGISNGCGPSTQADLRGYVPVVTRLLSLGYAVALTDYQGLGATDVHPYMEPRTAAFNVIDAVRALRQLDPSVSPRWIAFGASQGGQAAWAANEQNPSYGDGLQLLGSVAIAPAADLSALADLAANELLTADQLILTPLLITGLSRYNPAVKKQDFLRGQVGALTDNLTACLVGNNSLSAPVPKQPDVKPSSPQAARSLRTALRQIALPQQALSTPMLVVNGSHDQTVFPEWTDAAVRRSCQLGGHIQHDEIPGGGHDVVPDESVQAWVTDRFAGKQAPSTCPTSPQ